MIVGILALIMFIQYYAPETYKLLEVSITRTPAFIIGCYLGKHVKENKSFTVADYILFFSFIPLKIINSLLKDSDISIGLLSPRYMGIFGSFLIMFVIVMFFMLTDKISFIKKPLNKIFCFFGNLSLEIYIIHVLIYNAVLYYMPDIRKSTEFAFREKVLMYAIVLLISVILSIIFNKGINAAKDIIKSKKEKKT